MKISCSLSFPKHLVLKVCLCNDCLTFLHHSTPHTYLLGYPECVNMCAMQWCLAALVCLCMHVCIYGFLHIGIKDVTPQCHHSLS